MAVKFIISLEFYFDSLFRAALYMLFRTKQGTLFPSIFLLLPNWWTTDIFEF